VVKSQCPFILHKKNCSDLNLGRGLHSYFLSFSRFLTLSIARFWFWFIFILIYFEWRDTENQQYSNKKPDDVPAAFYEDNSLFHYSLSDTETLIDRLLDNLAGILRTIRHCVLHDISVYAMRYCEDNFKIPIDLLPRKIDMVASKVFLNIPLFKRIGQLFISWTRANAKRIDFNLILFVFFRATKKYCSIKAWKCKDASLF